MVYCATLCIRFVQKVQERWYEKLHEWEKALNAYDRQQEKSPDDTNFLYGRMRCLEALGEWCVFVCVITCLPGLAESVNEALVVVSVPCCVYFN